ncbi:glycosyltransferase [Desulfosoma caldarium]|uniref:Glycosyltransferase involved in cell wall biosynthesis n=1 Tax=Desulfosoma caldarium TaxID=610254 RepID=A0A3N1VS75_9BACT|nr:glycosyltransferase [Desulfosoma caldarium]ROR03092.1 glycosyltransferase involved in cell wall biosynthesis [Desulfosoma caldarium]
MKAKPSPWRLALFLATSGHSGVDRIMKNFIAELAKRPVTVDLLHVQGHGPYLEAVPANVRVVALGTRHVQSSLLKLVHYLRSDNPDAFLCDKDRVNRTALIASAMAGYQGRLVVRLGTTVSKNLEGRGFVHRLLQYWSIRHLYTRAYAVAVPSQGAAEDLHTIASFPQGFVRVLPSPVVSDTIHALSREPIDHPWFASNAAPVILGAGELCERKDFATLLRAFAALSRHTDSRLVILGKGKKRRALEKLAHDLGIADRVWFPGFVDNPYAYMAKARLFVLSSTCEGLPVVLMEALALGTPVVSTDCPSGPREILDHGRYGPLVPVKSPVQLAQAMARVLAHPPSKETLMGAVARYHIQSATDAYLQLLGYSGSLSI